MGNTRLSARVLLVNNAEISEYSIYRCTSLVLRNVSAGARLLDDPHHSQEHVRYVRNKIPFEVHFGLKLKLWGATKVRSDHLRVAAAITDSSVLNVDPSQNPVVSKAQLIFVTVIPLPLMLTAPVR